MFERLRPQPADPILALMQRFRDDPRPDKIDLGVGIWRDPDGRTPVFHAVKSAEERIWRTQDTKAYTGMIGDPAFHGAVADLLLGPDLDPSRLAASATTGGTSAVQTLLALAQIARPHAKVWVPADTWPNHWALAAHLGLETCPLTYYDAATGEIDRDAFCRDLSRAEAGDVVVFHACCHNPTGADPDATLQDTILSILARTGAVPLVDCAYLGFGDTPEADRAFLRRLSTLPEAMIAFSGSKSFGLYRERAGLALALGHTAQDQALAQSTLAMLNRVSYSFPPDHGARVVTEILQDPHLREMWETELSDIRSTLTRSRNDLAKALREHLQSARFDGLATQKGMFSLLPLGADRVTTLREDHGIYVVGDGRINFAGVTPATTYRIACALAQVLR